MLAFLFAATLGLCYCSSDNSTEVILDRPRLSGPSEALDGTVISIECALPSYPRNQTILLQLYKEGNHDKLLGEFSVLHKGNASIPIFVRPKHEGNLECVAKAQGNPNIRPTVSNSHYLRVIEPVFGVKIDIVSDATEFFEGAKLELLCQHSVGSHVSFEWRLNGQPVSRSRYRDAHLVINRTSPEDSGFYTCVATNNFNKTQVFSANSSVFIRVKELVSNPEISFEVIKEDSHNYSAAVTCRSAKGTPPVTFSLYNRTQLLTNTTTEDREATLKLPLVLGVNADRLQCRANNGDRTVYSQWIPIEVVPVSGPVTMTYDYDMGENYAVIGLRFYCKAAAGSQPQYRWFLNETLLNDSGSFYYVVNRPPEQSILLLSVGRRSAGTYRCEVRDSFDDSSAISSKRLFVSKEVLNRLPVAAVAAVFGSFAFLVVMVSACCGFVMLFRRRECGIKPRPDLEMITTVPSCEDELDSSDFGEDYDLINAARDAEFDQEESFGS
ncbi:Fc receptor-like protein 3 [Takifugu rubripes]|uniref:Fc receptor-like protein 3 n=1 Tax=Takifugu rubripes TaxID=31033 RepID=UPI00114531B3|nr:Fc receptor-like protein 3 [Takifugu rubripes]